MAAIRRHLKLKQTTKDGELRLEVPDPIHQGGFIVITPQPQVLFVGRRVLRRVRPGRFCFDVVILVDRGR